jgi:Uma2 family endonuclease
MIATAAQRTTIHRLSRAQLRQRWRDLSHDRLVAAIPYKVELNEKGSIEVSPAPPRHGMLQAFVAQELGRLRPDGTAITECPIETSIGVRVPDVVWASASFMAQHAKADPFPVAPELCVEVLSPSNTKAEIDAKVAAYLEAGATEVWLVPEHGAYEIFTRDGRATASTLGIELDLPA